MVSPAPFADLGPPPPSLRGFERIERTLRLVEDGAVVVVEAPWLVTVRAATRRLMALDPDLAVVTRFEEFRAAKRERRCILWHLRRGDAPTLNLYRDVIRSERLRVVIWARPEDIGHLRDAAPDVFDWVRSSIRLPRTPPDSLVDGLREARDAPGILWWDRRLDDVWAASAAGRRLWRLSVDGDYRVMRERLRGVPSGDGVVWEGVMRREDVWRIRWLGAESRRRGIIIERPAPALASPGWWPLGASDPDDPRVSTLYRMKVSHPSRVAALTGYRPHWLDASRRAAERHGEATLLDVLMADDAPTRLAEALDGLPFAPHIVPDLPGAAEAVRRVCRRVDARGRRGRVGDPDSTGIRVSRLSKRGDRAAIRLVPGHQVPDEACMAWAVEAALRVGRSPAPRWLMEAAEALGCLGAARAWAVDGPPLEGALRQGIAITTALRALRAIGARYAELTGPADVAALAEAVGVFHEAMLRVDTSNDETAAAFLAGARLAHRSLADLVVDNAGYLDQLGEISMRSLTEMARVSPAHFGDMHRSLSRLENLDAILGELSSDLAKEELLSRTGEVCAELRSLMHRMGASENTPDWPFGHLFPLLDSGDWSPDATAELTRWAVSQSTGATAAMQAGFLDSFARGLAATHPADSTTLRRTAMDKALDCVSAPPGELLDLLPMDTDEVDAVRRRLHVEARDEGTTRTDRLLRRGALAIIDGDRRALDAILRNVAAPALTAAGIVRGWEVRVGPL